MHATILLVASYISLQIFSDIGSLRIVSLAGMSIDAGTFIYDILWTCNNTSPTQVTEIKINYCFFIN